MITKQIIKNVHALQQKKYRDEMRLFVAESPKVITDLLSLMPCHTLFATQDFLNTCNKNHWLRVNNVIEITQSELDRLSVQQTPRGAVAIFHKPYPLTENWNEQAKQIIENELCLALDDVQDPGNLGTIIRIADWFGISHIFASLHTADVFSPKVVQATMGAIGRVQLHYIHLPSLLQKAKAFTTIYGTFLNGENIYQAHLSPTNRGIIVMGNEGTGISAEVKKEVSQRLYIPNFHQGSSTSESLNVAVATAIVCAEFCRRYATNNY